MLFQMIELIIGTVVTFFVDLLLLRMLLHACNVPVYTQFAQFVFALTSWLVMPLRQMLPIVGRFDVVSFMICWFILFFEACFLMVLSGVLQVSGGVQMITLFFLAFIKLLLDFVDLFCYLVIAQAILSWVRPLSVMANTFFELTGFLLKPLKRVMPPIAGIDVTPLLAILLLQVLRVPLLQSLPLWWR